MKISNACLWIILVFAFSAICQSEETAPPEHRDVVRVGEAGPSRDEWRFEEVRRLKVADTTRRDGFQFEGPVAWIGKSDKPSSLILATSGEGSKILYFGYQWDVGQKTPPELLELPYGRPRFFEMPTSAVWSADSEGVLIYKLPQDANQPIRIQSSGPLKDIVAGSQSQGYVIQRRDSGELWVWDLNSSTVLHVLKTETKVDAVAVSRDGMRIAAAGMPFEAREEGQPRNASCSILRVWDLGEIQPSRAIYVRNMGFQVTQLEFSTEEQRLLCAGIDDVFNPPDARRSHVAVLDMIFEGWSPHYEFRGFCTTACFVNNSCVAVGTLEGRILVLDINRQQVAWEHNPQQDGIYCLHMHEGDLLSGGGDGTVCIWRLSGSAPQKQ